MLDILFIQPPWLRKSGDMWKIFNPRVYPIGLTLLASFIREKGFSSSILDCEVLQIKPDNIRDYLPSSAPKFIGITAFTQTINNALEIAKIVKEKYLNVKVIIGGVHATFTPEETLSSNYIDYVIRGEGEYSLLEILLDKPLEKIKGIAFKKNGKVFINSPREIISDINILPFPAYDLLQIEKYDYFKIGGRDYNKPIATIVTSRGCPGQCSYCSSNYLGDRIRFRSAEKIIEEIVFLQKNYNIRDIEFMDDNFTTDRKRVKEFCRLVLKNNLDLTWHCFSRADTVDLETLKEMKKAGCETIHYGLESAVPQILKNINKKISFQKAKEAVLLTKKMGLKVRLSIMIGNPGETEKMVQETIKYAISLDPYQLFVFITTPFPGTKMLRWAKENNLTINPNLSDYGCAAPVMKLSTISVGKIRKYYKIAYFKFYFRPLYIIKRLKDMRTEKIINIFKILIDLVKFFSAKNNNF